MTAHVHHSARQPVTDAEVTPGVSDVSREGFLSSLEPANTDSKKTKKSKSPDFEQFFQLSQNGLYKAFGAIPRVCRT